MKVEQDIFGFQKEIGERWVKNIILGVEYDKSMLYIYVRKYYIEVCYFV